MANITINSLPVASTIDGVNDYLPIYTNTGAATQGINRNTLLNLASGPVGLTDSQVLTNKTLTSPTINGATLSGTLAGTYTIGGTPTFPATVVQTTSSQTLTNKTLTSPTINSPTITNATINADTLTGYTTSNSGTIYGIPVTTGTMSASYLTASTITNTQIASAGLYTSKVYNPYKFNYYRNSALTLTSAAFTTLIYDTVTFDTGSNYSNSTGKFTAPVAGFYQFQATINCQTAPATNITLSLFKNVSTEVARGVQAFSGSVNAVILSALISLSASDTIQVEYFSSSAVAISTGIVTQFSGFLVSAT